MNDSSVTVVTAGAAHLDMSLVTLAHPDIEVIAHVQTGDQALAQVLTELPDLLLLDVHINDPDARAICRRLREWAPVTKVLAVASLDDEWAYTTVVAGAAGCVLAGSSTETIARAVVDVAHGESCLLARTALRLMHDIDAWAARAADPLHPPPTLTATEREVLARLSEGAEPETIAAAHAVTPRLVNLHAGFAVAKLHRYVLGAERVSIDTEDSRHVVGDAADGPMSLSANTTEDGERMGQ